MESTEHDSVDTSQALRAPRSENNLKDILRGRISYRKGVALRAFLVESLNR